MSAAAATPSTAAAPRHPWLWRLIELAGLFALAVARPVLELAADTPEFFTVRDASDVAVVAFAVVLLLIAPLLLLAIEALSERARPGLATRLHTAFLVVLLAALAIPFLTRLAARFADATGVGITGWLLLAAALALGAAATVIAGRWPPARSFLRALGIAPPIVLALYLADAPLSGRSYAPPTQATRPAPIVMVVFDELPTASLLERDGAISRTRVPAFAALARDATWWPDATTVGDTTPHAVPSLLGGGRPRIGKPPSVDTWPRNLFTLLAAQYDVDAIEPITGLCPRSVCRESHRGGAEGTTRLVADAARLAGRAIAPPDLREHLPPVVGEEGTLTEPEAEVESFLELLDPGTRPTLDFLHVLLPHHPWTRRASGARYSDPGDGDDGLPQGYTPPNWTEDAAVVRRSWQRHLEQVSYADRVLGRIVARLRAAGTYDRTLLIVAADHGISFEPGGPMRYASPDNLGAVAAVPLFMKLPGNPRGRTVRGRAELSSVLPTVLDVLGAPERERRGSLLDGRSGDSPITVNSSYGRDLRSRPGVVARQREAVAAAQPGP